MRRPPAAVVKPASLGLAIFVTVAAVGWYLDWYKVHNLPAPAGHRGEVAGASAADGDWRTVALWPFTVHITIRT